MTFKSVATRAFHIVAVLQGDTVFAGEPSGQDAFQGAHGAIASEPFADAHTSPLTLDIARHVSAYIGVGSSDPRAWPRL